MRLKYLNLLARFARYGVLHREQVKNDSVPLTKFIKLGFVRKVYNSGRVFYELTEAALPLLEHYRMRALEDIRICTILNKSPQVFEALLDDVRFLDENDPDADSFLFLGDWQLTRPVTAAALELAKLRFYSGCVAKRTRKIA